VKSFLAKLRHYLLSDPDPSLRCYIVLPKAKVGEVLDSIATLGIFEPAEAPQRGEVREALKELESYHNLLERAKTILERFLEELRGYREVELEEIPQPEEFRKLLARLVADLEEDYFKLTTISEKLKELSEQLTRIALVKALLEKAVMKYGRVDRSLFSYSGDRFAAVTLLGDAKSLEEVKKRAVYIIAEANAENGSTSILSAVYPKEKLNEITNLTETLKLVNAEVVLNQLNWFDPIGSLEHQLIAIRSELDKLIKEKNEIIEKNIEKLALLKYILDNEYEKVKLLHSTLASEFTTLIIGWIPSSKRDLLISHLKRSSAVAVYTEPDPNGPTEFNNLKPFKPFELITSIVGIPSLNEWDPTPLLTYAFIMFYAIMLGDAGYAIGTLLAVKFVLPKIRLFVDNPYSEGFRKLQKVIYIGSAAGIVVGLLTKNVFGDLLGEYLPWSPVINLGDIGAMIKLSLVIGLIWIAIAHTITLAKALKIRDFWGAVFELGMLIILIFGPFYVLKHFLRQEIALSESLVDYIVYGGVAILIAAKIVQLKAFGAFLWIFDITGAMGDIFSFLRIAGIASGSTLLVSVFNEIIRSSFISFSGLGIIVSAIVAVPLALMLHLFILITAPIGPFVHSLRLCIYEIAGKFFEGTGRRIKPVKINLTAAVTLKH